MISKIFLGKAWHWLLLIVASALFWFCGGQRLHVIEFNIFVSAMLLGTVATVGLIIALHRPGDQVTRDPLVESTPDDDARPMDLAT